MKIELDIPEGYRIKEVTVEPIPVMPFTFPMFPSQFPPPPLSPYCGINDVNSTVRPQ